MERLKLHRLRLELLFNDKANELRKWSTRAVKHFSTPTQFNSKRLNGKMCCCRSLRGNFPSQVRCLTDRCFRFNQDRSVDLKMKRQAKESRNFSTSLHFLRVDYRENTKKILFSPKLKTIILNEQACWHKKSLKTSCSTLLKHRQKANNLLRVY